MSSSSSSSYAKLAVWKTTTALMKAANAPSRSGSFVENGLKYEFDYTYKWLQVFRRWGPAIMWLEPPHVAAKMHPQTVGGNRGGGLPETVEELPMKYVPCLSANTVKVTLVECFIGFFSLRPLSKQPLWRLFTATLNTFVLPECCI